MIIAEPGARLGFAGRRVIEQTIKQTLPPDFQTAEFLLANGLIDLIRPRQELRPTLARLLSIGSPQQIDAPDEQPEVPVDEAPRNATRGRSCSGPGTSTGPPRSTTSACCSTTSRSCAATGSARTTPRSSAGSAGWPASRSWSSATRRATRPPSCAARNFGMPTPAGYRKAARLMSLAAKLGIPVVSLIDTPGAYPGKEAEQHGQAIAIAENLRLMSQLPVPVVSVVTGEGGSGGALALGVANHVLICANAVYSVISPEGCAAILWNDPAAAPRAAEALRMTAAELAPLGIVDRIVPEPPGGTQADHVTAGQHLRAALLTSLRELLPQRPPDSSSPAAGPGSARSAP